MKKVCCVGHITHDKIITPQHTDHLNGGTAYYFAHGMARLPQPRFSLVTAVGADNHAAVKQLRNMGVDVKLIPGSGTVYFENTYGENSDHRTQRVLSKADPFRIEHLTDVHADIFHLGSLLADDFAPDLIRYLSTKGLVSLDVQGFLRRVVNTNVLACDWEEKEACLKYVDILKVNEHEMHVLTGETEVLAAARRLEGWGVREVVITEGSLGSFIYAEGKLVEIRAYPPRQLADATGCGDTYMTGYLYKRAQGAGYREAGCYAAAMSTLKLEHFGPFSGTEADILRRIDDRELDMTVR